MRIEVDRLTKRFGRLTALCDVSLEIPSGRRVALIGPNGSGKSTLNRALMGLLRYQGTIRLDGRSALDERAADRRSIGYVPQIAPALAVPVRELVRAFCALRGKHPTDVAKLAASLALDLAVIAHKPFRSLSGGMKQKLLIALALSSDSRLLLLDEPTGSLDARSRERFFPLFENLPRETTLVLCSHRLEEVRQLVDHVLMLDEGRLVYDGPAQAFLDSTTSCLVEVCAGGAAASAWLASHGFRRGAGEWWLRTVGRAEKLALLPQVSLELGAALRDLSVRDLETLDLESEKEAR